MPYPQTGRMIRILSQALLVTLAITAFSTISNPLMATAMDSSEWASLSRGQVVINQPPVAPNSVPSVEAKILIARPQEKVWNVVADPPRLMSDESKVKKARVVSRSGNHQNVEFSVLMTRLLPTFNYTLQQDLSPPSLLQFHRISGAFRDIQGSWRLIPVDNGKKTILTYTLKLDPGPLVPRGMLLNAVKSDLPTMMRNAKSAIDKNTL